MKHNESVRRVAPELPGWYGMLAIIGACALVSFKVIGSDGYVYQLLNLTGALGLFVISIVKQVRQNIVLNAFWALIAAVAIYELVP